MFRHGKSFRFGWIGLAVLILAGSGTAAPQKRIADLPATYQKWLDEEVVHLLAPLERNVPGSIPARIYP